MTTVESLQPPRLDESDLQAYFANTWQLYEWLFSSVTGKDALFSSPDPLRNPLVFYLGHTAAFSINKLVTAGLLPEGVDPHLDTIFARGVDPATADDLDVLDQWPSEAEVRAYRSECFARISEVIRAFPTGERIDEAHPYWAVHMGLEHDRIHFETSSVLIRQAPLEVLTRPEGWKYAPRDVSAPAAEWIPFPATTVRLGKPGTLNTYGWDNEYGAELVEVRPFEASSTLVTNAEFQQFVEAGGYRDPRFWCGEGWAWVQRFGVTSPAFWRESAEGWMYRAMFDEFALPQAWPAEVNWLEADAFCRWRGDGVRLLSEPEFAAITDSFRPGKGDVIFSDACNLNLRYGSPSAVGSLPDATSPEGIHDPLGNVWVWLADAFRPLKGFQAHPYYDDFSAPYFDDDHMMMLGGSWASSGTSASRYYRLWFRKYFYQHAGFRLARSR